MRRGLRTVLTVALLLAIAGATGAWPVLRGAEEARPAKAARFHSRPDLRPDTLRVLKRARSTAPGYVFLAVKRGPGQDGPMIVDDRGRVVWFRPAPQGMAATLFQVQRYRGEPVLVWWQGRTRLGHGEGEYVILDRRYREVARVRAGRGLRGDHHEIQLTRRGTALISVYAPRRADLRSVGGPRRGTIFESVIQEIDVASGRVVWEWHSADHFPVAEGKTPPKSDRPHDYFHINAIEVDRDGNLIVSARNMHAIYKIHRRTGRVMWRLGGRRSDFEMGPGTRFAFQHDARRRADGTLSLFDNQATPPTGKPSRGLVLALDERAMTARLVRSYPHPARLVAGAECNVQTLPGGRVFISWGPEERVSELGRRGRLLFDLALPPGADTYQAFRFPWRGEPLDRPALAARRTADGRVTVWASWNGATEVARWEVLAGEDPEGLAPIGSARRDGFETTIRVATDAPHVAVRALDRAGRALGESRAIEPQTPN